MPSVRERDAIVANQVFIGCPWKTVRSKYDRAISSLVKRYPLSWVIVGRESDQVSDDLLDVIKRKLETSTFAVLDATGGNANVSLEYGFAEGREIPRAIYLCVHRRAADRSEERAIISDLAGRRRKEYKQEAALVELLSKAASEHSYSKRFETFLARSGRRKSKGQKKSRRALALKIVHALDDKDQVRRSDVVEQLRADASGYDEEEISSMILELHTGRLLESPRGRHPSLSIR